MEIGTSMALSKDELLKNHAFLRDKTENFLNRSEVHI
jgi:hypothetical protein